jgi:hypothetical protein
MIISENISRGVIFVKVPYSKGGVDPCDFIVRGISEHVIDEFEINISGLWRQSYARRYSP